MYDIMSECPVVLFLSIQEKKYVPELFILLNYLNKSFAAFIYLNMEQ